jgi:hypothetical protein
MHTIHLSIAICRGLSPFPHRLYAQWETPPCGAEPRFELGLALQQADALSTEPRRTITEPRRTITELRRTITEPGRTISEPCRTITEPRRTIRCRISRVRLASIFASSGISRFVSLRYRKRSQDRSFFPPSLTLLIICTQ